MAKLMDQVVNEEHLLFIRQLGVILLVVFLEEGDCVVPPDALLAPALVIGMAGGLPAAAFLRADAHGFRCGCVHHERCPAARTEDLIP